MRKRETMDALLVPFLTATDEVESARSLGQLISEQAAPVIKGIIKSRLNIFLSATHAGVEANDAEDLYGDVVVQLLVRLTALKTNPTNNPIEDFRSYAAVLTYNTCHDYLRKKYPQRHSLKNQLRYLLTHQAGFALWEGKDKEILCGFAAWQRKNAQPISISAENLSADLKVDKPALGSSIKSKNLADLLALIFDRAGSPIRLQDMVSLFVDLLEIKAMYQPFASRSLEEESRDYLDQLPDPQSSIDTEIEQREYLQQIWKGVCGLPSGQRAALLLNLRDPNGSDAIALLTVAGVVSLRQIAEALEIPAEQMAVLWNELPLDDSAIARHLGITRQQVINLRKSARERLARRLRVYTKEK